MTMDLKAVTDKRVSDNVRRALHRSGVTQTDAARAARMNNSGLSRSLHGMRQWRVDEVVRLARALDVTVEELVG